MPVLHTNVLVGSGLADVKDSISGDVDLIAGTKQKFLGALMKGDKPERDYKIWEEELINETEADDPTPDGWKSEADPTQVVTLRNNRTQKFRREALVGDEAAEWATHSGDQNLDDQVEKNAIKLWQKEDARALTHEGSAAPAGQVGSKMSGFGPYCNTNFSGATDAITVAKSGVGTNPTTTPDLGSDDPIDVSKEDIEKMFDKLEEMDVDTDTMYMLMGAPGIMRDIKKFALEYFKQQTVKVGVGNTVSEWTIDWETSAGFQVEFNSTARMVKYQQNNKDAYDIYGIDPSVCKMHELIPMQSIPLMKDGDGTRELVRHVFTYSVGNPDRHFWLASRKPATA